MIARKRAPRRYKADSSISNKKETRKLRQASSPDDDKSQEDHHRYHDQQQHVNHLSTISEESQDNKQDMSCHHHQRIESKDSIELTISRSWIDFCCWHDQTRQ
jgi:hypothetical protein